jgi:hypothetical protein
MKSMITIMPQFAMIAGRLGGRRLKKDCFGHHFPIGTMLWGTLFAGLARDLNPRSRAIRAMLSMSVGIRRAPRHRGAMVD